MIETLGIVDSAAERAIASQFHAKNLEIYGGYDASLVNLDIEKNSDEFCILQLVKDKDNDSIYTVVRTGHTGSEGSVSVSLSPNPTAAVKLFEEEFMNKTGNPWKNRQSFKKKVGKFDMLKLDNTRRRQNLERVSKPLWEYYMDDHVDGKSTGWYPYTEEGAMTTEELYETYITNSSYPHRVVKSGYYSYYVDLENMTQKNSSTNKTRYIRRTQDGDVVVNPNMNNSRSKKSGSQIPHKGVLLYIMSFIHL
jgi:hypothetical protein